MRTEGVAALFRLYKLKAKTMSVVEILYLICTQQLSVKLQIVIGTLGALLLCSSRNTKTGALRGDQKKKALGANSSGEENERDR